MKNLIRILIGVIMLTLSLHNIAMASPASPAMLDADGCHICHKVCKKYGLKDGQRHCHIFSPEAREAIQRANAWAATNDETQFGVNVENALDYVSLSEDKSQLIIMPISKNIVGNYKVVSQSCGFGADTVSLTTVLPINVEELFGIKVTPDIDGAYTYEIRNMKYPVIAVANNHLIIIDKSEHILCSGQFVKNNLYLYCKGSFTKDGSVSGKGFCRSSMIKE